MMSAAAEGKEKSNKRNRSIHNICVDISKKDMQTKMIDYLTSKNIRVITEMDLPREFPYVAALEQAYLVSIVGHNVFKTTNCQTKQTIRQLLKEHQVGQKLKKYYTCICKYPTGDIIVPDIQMIVLEKGVICMLVMSRVGTSAQRWMSTEPKIDEILLALREIGRIHTNLLKIRFFHSDIKPHNILIRLGEKRKVEVSFCDFGLSRFFSESNSNSNLAGRGTEGYRLSSFVKDAKCRNYVLVSTFQYVITILSIYLRQSISRIWRCNHEKCSHLHLFRTIANKTFLMAVMNLENVQNRQSRAACNIYKTGGVREGANARRARVTLHKNLCNALTHTNPILSTAKSFLQSIVIDSGHKIVLLSDY
jgi:serine/threonine protein kinase